MTDPDAVTTDKKTPSNPKSLSTATSVSKTSKAKGKWNTTNLPGRLATDLASAACAASLIAPVIATIDKAIIENAAGKAKITQSIVSTLKLLVFKPHRFFLSKPLGLIFCVYGGTYLCANTIDTILSTVRNKPISHVTHGTSKFLATSATNVSLSLWKDSHFTQIFSNVAPRAVPAPTFAMFMLRDSLTIFASFNVPPLLAPHLPAALLPPGAAWRSDAARMNVAQFVAPAAVQFVSTPLHLMGLDMYNRKGEPWAVRLEMVKRAWLSSSLARIARIVPAFGVGGVINRESRLALMKRLE